MLSPKRAIFLVLCSFFTSLPCASGDEKIVLTGGQKNLPLPGESFQINGREAFVILPERKKESTAPIPWIWYAPTLKGLPGKEEIWMFRKFLVAGIAIAGIDVGESYGSPDGRKLYALFHRHLTEMRNFHRKPCLLARSRGGLMLYNWAIENPGKVSGIAGIYPVCNLRSYPGLAKAAPAYQLTPAQLEDGLAQHNPIERLAPLAKAQVPLFHLHGDEDRVVPLAENSEILIRRYRKAGGPAQLEIVQGGGHTMWPGWFRSQSLTDFAIARALGDPPPSSTKEEK